MVALAACAPGTVSGAEESPIALEAASPAQACAYQGRAQDEPLGVLVTLGPSDLADPASLEPLAACAPRRHLRIIARLSRPPNGRPPPIPMRRSAAG